MFIKTDTSKVNIDIESIARGLYGIFNESQKAALSFGMIDAGVMECLSKLLKEKAAIFYPDTDKILSKQEMKDFSGIGLDVEKINGKRIAKERADFVQHIEHEVCLALYKVAPMVV